MNIFVHINPSLAPAVVRNLHGATPSAFPHRSVKPDWRQVLCGLGTGGGWENRAWLGSNEVCVWIRGINMWKKSSAETICTGVQRLKAWYGPWVKYAESKPPSQNLMVLDVILHWKSNVRRHDGVAVGIGNCWDGATVCFPLVCSASPLQGPGQGKDCVVQADYVAYNPVTSVILAQLLSPNSHCLVVMLAWELRICYFKKTEEY